MHVVLMIYCSSFDEYKQVKFTGCFIFLWITVCFVICKIIHTFWFIYLIMFTLLLRICPHTYGSVCSIIFKASNLWSIKVSFLVHDYTILEFIFSFQKWEVWDHDFWITLSVVLLDIGGRDLMRCVYKDFHSTQGPWYNPGYLEVKT